MKTSFQDERFVNLKKKLDAMQYPQTLHPACIELVEKLLTDYSRLVGRYDKIKNKTINESNVTKNPDEQHQIDLLNDKNHELMQQINSLRAELADTGVQQRISKLQNTIHDYKLNYDQKVDDYNQQIQKLTLQVNQLTLKNSNMAQDNAQLRARMENKSAESEQYNLELTSLLEKKNKEIKELEEVNSKQRLKNLSLSAMIDKLTSDNQRYEQEHTAHNTQLSTVLKDQLQQVNQKLELAKINLNSEIKEKEEYRQEVRKLTQKILEFKNETDKSKSIETLQGNMKDKLTQLNEETKTLLDAKIQQVEALKAEKDADQREIERMTNKIKEFSNKNKVLTDNVNQTQQQISLISQKLTQKVKQLRESEAIKVSLERQLRQAQQINRRKTQQSLQVSSLQSSFLPPSQNTTLEKEISFLREQLQIFKENEHKLLLDKEKLSINIKKLQQIISEGNKQHEIIQNQKESLMRDNQQLQQRIQQGETTDYSSRNEIIRMKEKLESYEIHIEDMKSALKDEQINCKTLNQEVIKVSAELKKEKENNRAMHEDNKQLCMQFKDSENKRKQLFQQMKSTKERTHYDQDKNLEYKKALDELTLNYDRLEDELRSKKNAILTIDSERDQVQNLLDQKTQKIEQLSNHIRKLQKDMKSFTRNINDRQNNIQGVERRLQDLEHEKATLLGDHQQLYEEYNRCREVTSKQEIQLKEYENEMQLLVLSNKELQKEAEKVKNRLVDVDRKFKDKLKSYETQKEKNIGLEIMQKELTEELHTQKIEIGRLGGLVHELEHENNNMFNHLQDRDQQLQILKQNLLSNDRKQDQYQQQIRTYQQKVQYLSQDLDRLNQEMAHILQERDHLQMMVSKKESNSWKNSLETKNLQLEKEYQAKSRECNDLRKRVRDLEMNLNTQRSRNYQLESKRDGGDTPVRNIMIESEITDENWDSHNDLSHNDARSTLIDARSTRNDLSHNDARSTRNDFSHNDARSTRNDGRSPHQQFQEGNSYQSEKESISSNLIKQRIEYLGRVYESTIEQTKMILKQK